MELRGPPQVETSPDYHSEDAIINGPRRQVVPFAPRRYDWTPLKPTRLRIVWAMKEEEEEEEELAMGPNAL